MDGRFLIYNGFGNDVDELFKSFIKKYDLSILDKNDSGVSFENNTFKLDIFNETGLQMWFMNKKNNQTIMFLDLCLENEIDEVYWAIMIYINDNNYSKRSIIALCQFLNLSAFSDKFSDKQSD
jgi:hypothetical protein